MMTSDNKSRIEFWTRSLDEADRFMQEIMAYPVEENFEPMVSLQEAADAHNVEVIFSDTPRRNNLPRIHSLRKGLIPSFVSAAKEFNDRGLILKVEDGFRTAEIQRVGVCSDQVFKSILSKVQLECGCEEPPVDLMYRRVGALVALFPKVGTHMSGSAMDISALVRDTGEDLDRGALYIEMSEITPMNSPFISEEAKQNRALVTQIMRNHGFLAYPYEFWHYSAGDAYGEYISESGKPAKYGAVHMNMDTGEVTPIENPLEPVTPKEVVMQRIKQFLGTAADG